MNVAFWPILFLVIGLMLLVAEAFIPSGGFIGFTAVVCVGLSLWHAFQQSTSLGLTFLLVDLIVVPLTIVLAFWLWMKSPLSRTFLLSPPSEDEIDVSHSDHQLDGVVGSTGRALTPLRPSGHVEIEGRRYDGLADGGLIPAGSLVRVIQARSGQVIVQSLERPRVGGGDGDGIVAAADGADAGGDGENDVEGLISA